MTNKCKTILIVEDDVGIRDALKLTLEFSGYPVQAASNGKDALELLATIEKPCLILLDLMMPVMDGWTFAEVVNKDVMLATIPIVVVTAFADDRRPVAHVARVVKKPVDMDLLLQLVGDYCG